MEIENKTVVRCRGIIVHEDKLLVVKHSHDTSFAALPGGKLEKGENVDECMRRELIEELGVEPVLGPLLYVYTFLDGERQSVEFFFHIKNAEAYLKCAEIERTHAHEIEEMLWVHKNDDIHILPKVVHNDFKNRSLFTDQVRYVKG